MQNIKKLIRENEMCLFSHNDVQFFLFKAELLRNDNQ